MNRLFSLLVAVLFFLQLSSCVPIVHGEGTTIDEEPAPVHGTYDPLEEIIRRAPTTRIKATTVPQSINNWIQDVDTVNRFLNIALSLPAGVPLKQGAAKALTFAQDEPVNVRFLKATPGIDAAGLAAASTLERVFGDVLDHLGNVVKNPLSVPVAVNAVTRININRCKNVLPAAETMWKSAAVAMNMSTSTWPPKANREIACPGNN
ncbi:hypothetical protein BP5796_02123 [Coleophoma crateriformis]|uniref:Uncharacterized protein n=1 Tax=Coleophoma crateriformis TaxID=565419 RepID=A0A3D8SYW3_9HELO|nr:hypothetical protein BP5796_02123 [Coleophoma crateriformis]